MKCQSCFYGTHCVPILRDWEEFGKQNNRLVFICLGCKRVLVTKDIYKKRKVLERRE